jgi:hypothetical protein
LFSLFFLLRRYCSRKIPDRTIPNLSTLVGLGRFHGRAGMVSQQATMQIQQDGSKLSGTFQDADGSSSVTGSIPGNNVSFGVQMQGRPVTLVFTGTIAGDKMSGTFQPQAGGGGGGGQGNHTWSGVRQQGN